MSDPVLEAFDTFADAVEIRLAAMRTEIAELKSGALSVRAPVAEPQSVDEGVLKALVQDAVSRLPAPEPGQPGKDASVDMAAVEMMVNAAVVKAVAGIPTPRDGTNGTNGVDGKSVDPDEVQRMVRTAVESAVATIPKPKDGRDGTNGTNGESVDVVEVQRMVQRSVDAAVAAIPKPVDGRNGIDADVEAIAAIAAMEARKAVAALPPARDGRDAVGIPGKDGTNGRDGKDAMTPDEFKKAIAEAEERMGKETIAKLMETLTVDGREVKLGGVVVGRLASTIYRKTWQEGEAYEPGDLATWGGSLWHANVVSKGLKPGDGKPEWTLAVKRGNDGKDAKS